MTAPTRPAIRVTPADETSLAAQRVSQIMSTSVFSVDEQESLAVAGVLMQRRHIRHLPVTRGSLVTGLLSETDVARSVAAMTWSSLARPVASAMCREVVQVSPDAGLAEAARMLGYSSSGVVVVLEAGTLVGVLTADDIVGAVARLA